jgi:flagellar protein FlbT
MALKLEFKAGEKMIVNGAVIENVGPHARLLLHNRANIMRGREILTAEESRTPASRTYFALQCAYLFPEKRDAYLAQFEDLLAAYLSASPSALPIGEVVRMAVASGDLYKALREMHALVRHELYVLQSFYQSLEDQIADPPEGPDETDPSGSTDPEQGNDDGPCDDDRRP